MEAVGIPTTGVQLPMIKAASTGRRSAISSSPTSGVCGKIPAAPATSAGPADPKTVLRFPPQTRVKIFSNVVYIPLSHSPASSYTWPFIRARWRSSEKYTEGLHPERPARGAVLYTGQSRPCIEHKGPPSTKNMHTKDGHDSRGRNYKLRRSSPRPRGPPSQSESYVWDKALICRRSGESNSSI